MQSPQRTVSALVVVVAAGFAVPFGASTAAAAEPARLGAAPATAMASAFHSATRHDATGEPVRVLCSATDCDFAGYYEASPAGEYGAQGGPGTVAQAGMAGLAGGAAAGAVNGLSTGGDVNSMIAGASAGGLAGLASGMAAQWARNAAAAAVDQQPMGDETAFD